MTGLTYTAGGLGVYHFWIIPLGLHGGFGVIKPRLSGLGFGMLKRL